MSPGELEELLYEEPFKLFRVTLASGDRYMVNIPRRAIISGLSSAVGLNDDPAARSGTRLKLISIPNVVMAKQINPRRPAGGRRPRK
jgi:hypothetical protein